jgi:hypothetical protein
MKNVFEISGRFRAGEEIASASPEVNPGLRSKIVAFGKLEDGWDFGQGGAAPRNVVRKALALYEFGKRLGFEMDAFPGAGGDVAIDYYVNDEVVQILVDTDLSLELTHERGVGSHYDEVACFENVSLDSVVRYLRGFIEKGYTSSWNSPEYCTEESTGQSSSDSPRTASRNLMGQSRWLKSSASKNPARQSVSTSYGTMLLSLKVSPSLSGSFVTAT